MKNATEIAQITINANKRRIAERHDRTMTYINNTMNREIERRANMGDVDIIFKVSTELDLDTIERVFTEHGFEVSAKGHEIKISWFKQYFNNRG